MGTFGTTELIMLAAIAASTIVWFWALFDCMTHEAAGSRDKRVWLLVLFFGGCFGPILYLVLRRPRRIRDAEAARQAS